MTSLQIIFNGRDEAPFPIGTTLATLWHHDRLLVRGSGLFHQWKSPVGDNYFLLGHIVGIRQGDNTLSDPLQTMATVERLVNPDLIPEVEGRFVLVKIGSNGSCEIWTDQFGRIDLYWQQIDDLIVAGTGLNLLPISIRGSAPDTVGVAHSLTVYGSRPAKQHTLYSNVHRLGVNQGLRLSNGKCELLKRHFKPVNTRNYVDASLHQYTDIFLEAIRARASSDGNVVWLSSGWDSTSILAALVHLFGKSKVRAVIGRMRYAERSGVINQFEMDRATAIANYFGVRLDIVELDYRKDAGALLLRLKDIFRSQNFANLTGFNHWMLAEGTAKTATSNEVVFAGEMSDGAHNLGFSQYATIFHPASFEFREYSDKMASYLFGPTFLGQLKNREHENDPVWQLFKHRSPNTRFDQLAQGDHAIHQQLLASFFLRGGRMPLYSLENSRMLTADGRTTYAAESERVYLRDISPEVTQENLYACYLHLYNSFHWQGSTVATTEHATDAFGLKSVLPFHDSALIDFLSAMPESWGRGLDFNHTKYPLKWMLKNRIDYPNHLQVGPHSYIYDVNPSFSLFGEVLHESSLSEVFRESLRQNRFVDWLGSDMFDRMYIDGIVRRYLQGEQLHGQEMNDLGVLAMHSAIGFYGQD